MSGIRGRLILAFVGVVAVTVAGIGIGTYAFVEGRLRDALVADGGSQAQFDLSVLLPGRLPGDPTQADFVAAGLPAAFAQRGSAALVVDFGDGDPYLSRLQLVSLLGAIPDGVRRTIDAGRLGYAWLSVDGNPSLVVGGRSASGPTVYLVLDAAPLESALGQLRIGLLAAGLLAVLLALVTAGFFARRILRPIATGSAAAARIASGDLATRVPIEGRDELATWATEFNRMADSLGSTIASLEAAQAQNRRFVADVAHELRTPLTALVAEASVIEGALGGASAEARRAGELLVADVRRLRDLVEDLMELSRFDAAAESLRLEPVDLGRVVRAIVAARLPEATISLPSGTVVIDSDVRRLDRILGNLLDNARTHAPGSPVEVALERSGGMARISVADRGPGVPPELLDHLFDRFFKADPSRVAGAGGSSGLGLAIAAEHARLLGGGLAARRRDGGGLELTLTLPVTEPLPGRDGPDTGEVEAVEASEPASRTLA